MKCFAFFFFDPFAWIPVDWKALDHWPSAGSASPQNLLFGLFFHYIPKAASSIGWMASGWPRTSNFTPIRQKKWRA